MRKLFQVTLLTASVVALSSFTGTGPTPNSTSVQSKPVDLKNFDLTVKPGDDFYQYVNGGWIKNNPLPATEVRWGSFSVLDELTRNRLKTILDEIVQNNNAAPGSAEQKIRDFYKTAMDSLRLEKDGAKPLLPLLQRIDKITDLKSVYAEVAYMHSIGIRPFFTFYVGQDDKNSANMIVNLFQGGLGMPDRDYYLKDDKESLELKEKYKQHIIKMLFMTGTSRETATIQAESIVKLETSLAAASRTRVELRDPEANYNFMSMDELHGIAPDFAWDTYFKDINVSVTHLIVGQPKFFDGVNSVFKNTPIDEIKNYLKWNIIDDRATTLSHAFVQADFDFYQATLSGAKEMKPRWKRVLGAMNGTMGELLGQIYVKKYFSADSKAKVNKMVENLVVAYKERISSRTWMAPETKTAALAKLDKVTRKLAYPDKWRDYSNLNVSTDSYCDNVTRASQYSFNYNVNKLGKPVDKSEWGMSPQTINAYYNPGFNEIVFPAAIMQSPFFDPNADDAVNYGRMGAVIGHELTHGFDDQGNQYDAEGNLKNWWTEEDKARFKMNTDKLVKQYSAYTALDTLTVNGALTLGENIADLGGLTIAYAALQKALGNKPRTLIDGYTPEQRLFISFAQVWRNNIRDAELKRRLKTDPHSPGRFRTLGPLANMPEFYKAFDVKPGDKMYIAPENRCEIW